MPGHQRSVIKSPTLPSKSSILMLMQPCHHYGIEACIHTVPEDRLRYGMLDSLLAPDQRFLPIIRRSRWNGSEIEMERKTRDEEYEGKSRGKYISRSSKINLACESIISLVNDSSIFAILSILPNSIFSRKLSFLFD